jgi:hypothetical protein
MLRLRNATWMRGQIELLARPAHVETLKLHHGCEGDRSVISEDRVTEII